MVNLIESTCSRHTPEETENLEKLHEFLRGLTPFRDHVINVMVAGEPRWWALTGKPLLNTHGQLTGWRGVGSDITHGHRTRI
ncbi:PAS domain-containing protein, partial [Acinetobacter baumannii]